MTFQKLSFINLHIKAALSFIEIVKMLQTPAPRNQFSLKMYSIKILMQPQMNEKKLKFSKKLDSFQKKESTSQRHLPLKNVQFIRNVQPTKSILHMKYIQPTKSIQHMKYFQRMTDIQPIKALTL